MPRSVWINQRLSHVLLSCLYSIFLSAVSFTVLVFVHVMIHSHCDGLCIYKKKCGICLWLHLFLFGWPHPEGVSVNLCRLILFIPGRKKNKTKLCLNYGMLFQTEQRRHRQHDCDVPSCMCKDRLAVKQLLQSGDTRPCLPSSLSNYWSKPGQKPPLFLSQDGMTELYPLSLSPLLFLHTDTHTHTRPPVLSSHGAPASLLSRPAQLLSKELSSFLPES